MKEIAKSYIEKRIKEIQYGIISDYADNQAEVTGMARAELAREEAQKGNPAITATHLLRDATLPISQKGEILAEAYAKSAEKQALLGQRYYIPAYQRGYLREARLNEKIAQGLRRAAQRSRDS
jgi:hypothetical protein